MSDDLVTQLRTYFGSPLLPVSHQAADEIERLRAELASERNHVAGLRAENARLREALQDIFDYECRTSSTSLIACTARDAVWPRAALAEKEK